jgi:hypothetical protein
VECERGRLQIQHEASKTAVCTATYFREILGLLATEASALCFVLRVCVPPLDIKVHRLREVGGACPAMQRDHRHGLSADNAAGLTIMAFE